jgi:hypothetical protein
MGKWMKVSGHIKDIFPTFLILRIPSPSPEYPDDYFQINLSFEPSSAEHFHSLGIGYNITAMGRLRAVNYGEIELEKSELA